jgi:hypothetical protein
MQFHLGPRKDTRSCACDKASGAGFGAPLDGVPRLVEGPAAVVGLKCREGSRRFRSLACGPPTSPGGFLSKRKAPLATGPVPSSIGDHARALLRGFPKPDPRPHALNHVTGPGGWLQTRPMIGGGIGGPRTQLTQWAHSRCGGRLVRLAHALSTGGALLGLRQLRRNGEAAARASAIAGERCQPIMNASLARSLQRPINNRPVGGKHEAQEYDRPNYRCRSDAHKRGR